MRSHPLKVAVLSIGHLLFALGILYPQSLKYKHYSLEDGLHHDVGYDIHQDKDGYIWFGLDNGLTRFDGQKFKNYTIEDGLNGPYAITINEDHKGAIWTGIHMEGLNYIRQDSVYKLDISRLFLDPHISHHKSEDYIINEFGPPPGKLRTQNLLAIQRAGDHIDSIRWMYMYHEEEQLSWKQLGRGTDERDIIGERYDIAFDQDTSRISLDLRELSNGEILLLGPLGVYQYDPHKLFSPFLPGLLPQTHFKEIDEDQEGNIWFLTDTELFYLHKGGELERFSIPDNLSNAIQFKVIRSSKIFFLSANRDQLWSLNLETGKQQEVASGFNLLSDISFIETDREHNLWFTTMGDGVFCIYDHGFQTFSKFNGLGSSYVNSLREDEDGSVLVCTEKGLDRIQGGVIEPVRWLNKIFPKGRRFIVKDILSLGEGNYLLSVNGPTYFINTQENKKRILGSYLLRRFQQFPDDSIGLFTLGVYPTQRQLNFLDLKTMGKDSIRLEIADLSHYVTPYPDKNHTGYWLNPKEGLLFLKEGKLKSYPLPEGLSQNESIIHIIGGPKGNTWFGTAKGVLRHDGEELSWVNKEKDWPIFASRQILFDSQQNMWMASPEGLYCYTQGKLNHYTTYGADIRSLMIDRKNRLWIGTSVGVSYVELESFPFRDQAPNLIIENVEFDGESILSTEISSISSKQTIHIDYVAVSFIRSENFEYAYQLQSDGPWQYTTNRSLDLTGLQVGDYQLKIKAKKANSDWSTAQIIPFTVSPPWYGTWWGYVLFGLLFLALILTTTYSWGNYTKSKAEAQNQIAYEMGQLKLQALQSQLNPHFIFNALHVIQGYIIKNDIAASNVYLSSFSHLMRRFLESSKQNEITLQEEIELLNLFVEMEQLCYKDKFEYVLEVAPNLQPDAIGVPSMLIQPFVENAIHHGLLKQEGKGKLKISFSSTSTSMKCLIEDNGIGREKAKELQQKSDLGHTSRGMQIVSERLKLQNQHNKIPISIKIGDRRSEMGDKQGTQVEIAWPLPHSTKTL